MLNPTDCCMCVCVCVCVCVFLCFFALGFWLFVGLGFVSFKGGCVLEFRLFHLDRITKSTGRTVERNCTAFYGSMI